MQSCWPAGRWRGSVDELTISVDHSAAIGATSLEGVTARVEGSYTPGRNRSIASSTVNARQKSPYDTGLIGGVLLLVSALQLGAVLTVRPLGGVAPIGVGHPFNACIVTLYIKESAQRPNHRLMDFEGAGVDSLHPGCTRRAGLELIGGHRGSTGSIGAHGARRLCGCA